MKIWNKLFGKKEESQEEFIERIAAETANVAPPEEDIDVNELKLPETKEDSTESQNKKIIKYLKQGHTITGLEALRMFECFSLPQRIHDLRSYGFIISTTMIKTPSKKRIAQYKLEE